MHDCTFKGNIDVSTISENKVDESFPIRNFLIHGFSTSYRSDCHSKGGGIMLFVREDIPCNLLTIENKPVKTSYVKLNLQNEKWLKNCSDNPHKNTIRTHIDRLSESSDLFYADYEKVSILVDFNVKVDDNHVKSFCENYGLKNLIKQKIQVIRHV